MGLSRFFCILDKELWKLCAVLLTWKSVKLAHGLLTSLWKFFSEFSCFLSVSQFLSFKRESLFYRICENHVNMKTCFSLSEGKKGITGASTVFGQVFSKRRIFIKMKYLMEICQFHSFYIEYKKMGFFSLDVQWDKVNTF